MKFTKELVKQADSSVKLTVKIGKKDVAEAYSATVEKYAKNMQLPGFRKGKVPVNVLERKFGKELKNDVAGDLVEKSLEEIFAEFDKEKSEYRPLAYSQPAMDKAPELDTTKDFSYEVTYDIMPTVTVTDFSGITVKEPQVTVGDKELNEELEAIRERNALVIEKKDDEKACKNDIVTIIYSELDDKDNIIEGTTREGFVFTIGSGENIYKIDDDIIGMKKDESKDIVKTYKEDFEDKDLAGKTKKIRVTITSLKVRNLPELDDELAQDVNAKYKTLQDMKDDIKKNLNTALENRLKEVKSTSLVEQLVEKYPVELPKSMINAELESRWRMMAQKFQTTVEQLNKLMASAGQKKEDMFTEWTKDAEKNLKGRIIIESLLKDSKIEVSDEEIEKEYEKIAQGAGITIDEVKKHYADEARKEYLIDDIKEQHLYDDLFSKVKMAKGDKTTFADLFKNA